MTTTTQELLRDIDLFNLVFPLGTPIKVNLVAGEADAVVSGKAELIGDEPMFKATYANKYTPLLSTSSVILPENYFADWFNQRYPVGTWVWCMNERGTYALQITKAAIEDSKYVFFEDKDGSEPITNVKGKLKAIIEFEDHDQDFLRWYINEDEKVVDSKPFQAVFWNGTTVNLATSEGEYLDVIYRYDTDERTIAYPIANIQRFDTEKEVQSAS